MMTAAEIAALSNDDALAAFQNLAADIYKTERWQAAFSRDTDTALRSISYWTSGSRRVPTWAILLLDAKAHAREVLSALQMVTTGLKLASDLSDTI